MTCLQKTRENKIQIASLRLDNGWSGRAVLLDAQGRKFSRADWIKCLSQPHLLFENVEKILKTEGQNCVAVKNLTIGDTQLKVVVKRHYPGAGLRQFFRSFQQGRALRNFDTALKLLSRGIPTAVPFAALHKRRTLFTEQSIYITEFFEDSFTLRNFASEQLLKKQAACPERSRGGQLFAGKKQLCYQLAVILATLHKNGLWHRDSKANNFIVCKNSKDKYKILLVDVDGIKPYFLRRKSRRFRSLWQLAASLLSVSAVNRTDYLRFFTAYCNLTGLQSLRRRRIIFRWLSNMAKAKHSRSAMRNILIIKPSSLGDIVLALPALSALRRSFPKAKISWFIRPEFAPLLKNHPDLSEVILFDRKFLGKAWYHPRAFASLVSLIWRLNRSKFDAVFDLQGLFRTASLAWLSGCRRRFGMADAGEFAHIFYTHKVAQDRDSIHLVDYYLKIVQAAGACENQVQFLLPRDSAAADAVSRLLKTNGIKSDSFAVFVPTSAQSDKCWPVERFAALADRVSKQFGLSIIATGSASEKDFIEGLRNRANVPIANFAGITSLGGLVALLKAARLVVSNDTGPGHIAAALGVPVVLIFGPTNPARVHPYNRPECAVAVEPDSRGMKADSADPKHDIKAVTLDEVYQKVCEQLSNAR
ncbi:MAG: glycosyltransferase family 9 protein [Sedimentisphaerales bacterium]